MKRKQFGKGDIMWKEILSIRTKDPRFNKWSPNLEGSYIVSQVIYRGVYRLVDMQEKESSKSNNGNFFKKILSFHLGNYF